MGGPQFVSRDGRKKQQGAEDGTGRAPDGGMEASVQETAASSQQYSEYHSSQCPDEFVASEDEPIQALGACQVGEGDPSHTCEPTKAPHNAASI